MLRVIPNYHLSCLWLQLVYLPLILMATIHTALAIPKECGNNVPAMSDQKRTQMRLSLGELKLIIIDEISMLSNIGLLHIHQRLKEIFVTPNSELFAGISILAFGDFFSAATNSKCNSLFKL